MRAPTRRYGGDGARGHAAAADGRAAPAPRRVVHTSWGQPVAPGNARPPRVWVAHPACWESRWRSAARSRIPRNREQRKTGETGTLQERWTLVAGRGVAPTAAGAAGGPTARQQS